MSLALQKFTLLAVCLAFLIVPSPGAADTMTFPVSTAESSTQPVLLDFLATPGVLLLCDSESTNASAPQKNRPG